MSDFAYQIAELTRRMDNMIRRGVVVEADYMAAPPLIKIKDGEFTSGWLPFMAQRAHGQEVDWDAPEIGERVIALSPSGDPANATIIPGALYCDEHPSPAISPDILSRMHADGAHDSYDRRESTRLIQIPDDGHFKVQIGRTVLTLSKDAADLTSQTITLKAETITLDGTTHLGGAGGEPVARKGDAISTQTRKITKGSDNVFST